ncbi:MAG TPA: hypothetical protein VKE95_00420, partial [Burkholderiales bacterium]|nr:hypothetical protein [Burkholderiales bacterium]
MKKPFGFAGFALVLFAGCAAASQPTPAKKLKVDPEESLSMVVPAKGVQTYECRASQGGAY